MNSEITTGIVSAVGGVVVPWIIQAVKSVKFIPISQGQTTRLRLLNAGLSVVIVLATGYKTGVFDDSVLKDALVVLLGGGITWVGSHLFYHKVMK